MKRRALAVLAVLAFPALTAAQPGPAPRPAAAVRPQRIPLAPAIQDLQSGEPARMERALPLLGSSGSPGVVAPLAAFIRRGPPGALLIPAIDALGALGRPEAQDVLMELLRHVRAPVRARAAVALAPLRNPRVSRALAVALGDREATVREAAARALATAGTRDAVDPLLAALQAGNDAAAPAVGALGDAAHCEKLVALVGRVPLPMVLPAFRLFLMRRDVSEAAKVGLVDQIAGLGTPEVRRFLEAVTGEVPAAQARLRQHMSEAAGRIGG